MANTPTISSPSSGSAVSAPFDLTGTGATPGALVEVRDDGGLLLPATLNPVAADGSGNWTIHVTSLTGSKTGSKNYSAATGAISTGSVGTNLLTSTEILQVGNTSDYTYAGGTYTLTTNYAAGPSGAYSGQASRFQFSAGQYPVMMLQNYTNVQNSTQYTLSWYIKLNTGTSHPTGMWWNVNRNEAGSGGTWTPDPQVYATLSDSTWTRQSVTFTSDTTATGYQLKVIGTENNSGDILLWGMKLETGATATGTPSNLG